MPFPLTPYLVLVLTGFAAFVASLAYGSLRAATVKVDRKS